MHLVPAREVQVDQVRADETGATGDQDMHWVPRDSLVTFT
jgi:hypothetical protein